MRQQIALRDADGWALYAVERPAYSRQGAHPHDCPFGYGWPIQSTTLICPYCNEVWARLTAEGQAKHNMTPAPCHECGGEPDEIFFPGSLLNNLWLPDVTDWDLLQLLPIELMRREASIALEYIECQQNYLAIGSVGGRESGMYSTASSTSASPSATSASQPSASPSP
jgi:hypothetical protein